MRRAGCDWRPGKGSHTHWTHELVPDDSVTLSGKDGDDAKPYQVDDVERLLRRIREARERLQ